MKLQSINCTQNIYHYCKRNFAEKNLLKIQLADEKRRLGALPIDWLKYVGHENYARTTKEVDRLFQEFALLTEYKFNEKKEFFQNYYQDFGFIKKLSDILKRKDINIEYVDEGAYKHCHKITVGNFKYALLTFKRDKYFKKQLEYDTDKGCGALLEPCRIFNLYKEYSQGRVAKPFMTRFVNNPNAAEYDGYMLIKFIDKNDSTRYKCDLPAFQKSYYKYKMTDFQPDNIINGVIVDIGMVIKNTNAMKSSKFRHNLFKFLGIIERNHKENFTSVLINSSDSKNAENIRIAIHRAEEFVYILMKQGLDIYSTDIREFIKNLEPLEQKYVKNKIRKLKRVHKLKTQLIEQNEYEKYKPLVDSYVQTYGSWTIKHEFL